MVGLGKLGAPKDPAVLKSPATAYEYMADLFPRTTVIGIPSPSVHGRPLEPRASYTLASLLNSGGLPSGRFKNTSVKLH